MLVVINDILEDPELAQRALGRLKEAFSRFALNRQKFPLVYERMLSAPYLYLICG